ncbi:MAG: hypothetical protein JHC38_08480 [Thiotrichales bacterium]|jgi:cysteinyl-tRNA synthetase|nr:hypothetical protein [Thiotrichales bacterium]
MGIHTMILPYEVYTVLEERLGNKEDAVKIAEAIKTAFANIETRANEVASQKKLEVKDELKRELRDELATKEDIANLRGGVKEDIANLRGEVKEEIANLRGEMRLYFMATIAVVLLLNKDALTLLGQILGLVK